MKMQTKDNVPGTTAGWWMAPGPALCPYCEQPHHIEAMLYCSDCDMIICSVCVVVSLGRNPLCPVCYLASGKF